MDRGVAFPSRQSEGGASQRPDLRHAGGDVASRYHWGAALDHRCKQSLEVPRPFFALGPLPFGGARPLVEARREDDGLAEQEIHRPTRLQMGEA